MRKRVAAVLVLAPALAHATPKGSITGRFDILSAPDLHVESMGSKLADELENAFAFSVAADFCIAPHLTLGFAPRYAWRIIPDRGDPAAIELDLSPRVVAHAASKAFSIYTYFAPGLSFLFLPDVDDSSGLNPKGIVVDFGAGFGFTVSPRSRLVVEMGYQWGWQGGEEAGVDYRFSTSFLHFGMGLQLEIGHR